MKKKPGQDRPKLYEPREDGAPKITIRFDVDLYPQDVPAWLLVPINDLETLDPCTSSRFPA